MKQTTMVKPTVFRFFEAFALLTVPNAAMAHRFLPDDLHCNLCGLSYSELRRTGLMGCANCYETFAIAVIPAIHATKGPIAHQ